MYKFYNLILNIGFDCIFSIFLVNSLVIFVWRIIWDTQDLYLENRLYLNSLISLMISYFLLFIVKYIQINEINSKFSRSISKLNNDNSTSSSNSSHNKKKICKKFSLKIFILIFSFANINHWRAVWNFTIEYTEHKKNEHTKNDHTKNEHSLDGILTIGALSILSLIAIKRVCALMSVPFQINKDCYQVAYQIQPTSVHHNYYLSLKNKYSNKVISFFNLIFRLQQEFNTISIFFYKLIDSSKHLANRSLFCLRIFGRFLYNSIMAEFMVTLG